MPYILTKQEELKKYTPTYFRKMPSLVNGVVESRRSSGSVVAEEEESKEESFVEEEEEAETVPLGPLIRGTITHLVGFIHG